ncbi:MAG: DUF6179 domain-containing protein [Eubacteriales bacterium]|jgi:hypothetical protein|nr:hypothetical protein [Clostridiales bacterium]
MNYGIERKQPELNPKNIRNSAYLSSLAEEGVRCGAMTGEEYQNLQFGLYKQLGEMISMYTQGESTSVMAETASELALALTYNIDAYLLSLGNHYTALEEIRTKTPDVLYVKGLQSVKLLVFETTSLLVKARRMRVNVPNYEYNNALDTAIPELLRGYDIKFAPHRLNPPPERKRRNRRYKDTMLDYPLAVPVVGAIGIHYLKSYLINLCSENKFCLDFGQLAIASLYKRFCDVLGESYDAPIVNIYTLALLNALFADYLKKEHGTLALTDDDIDVAQKLLLSFSPEERASILRKCAARLYCGDTDYNIRAFERLLPAVNNAIENNALGRLLVVG